MVEKLIAHSTNPQRCLLGFPKPTSAYWTRASLLAVKQRYDPLVRENADADVVANGNHNSNACVAVTGMLYLDEIEDEIKKREANLK